MLRHIIFALLFTSVPALAADQSPRLDAIYYMVSGGYMELTNPMPVLKDMHSSLDFLQTAFPSKHFSLNRIHQTKRDEACASIIELKRLPENSATKVILAGHSFGGDAVVAISHCLQQAGIDVDMLITIDSVHENPFTSIDSTVVIPENVRMNFNFYEHSDIFFITTGDNRRADKSLRGIHNVQQDMGGWSDHMYAVTKLIQFGVLQSLLKSSVEGLSEAETTAAVAPFEEQYFSAYPVVSRSGAE